MKITYDKKLIGAIIIVATLIFWWMAIRPVTYRQDCYDVAVEAFGISKNETNLRIVARQYDQWLPAYNACLKNLGI